MPKHKGKPEKHYTTFAKLFEVVWKKGILCEDLKDADKKKAGKRINNGLIVFYGKYTPGV